MGDQALGIAEIVRDQHQLEGILETERPFLAAFDLEAGKQAAFDFENALEVIRISNNLGDAKSLITHPATTTHQRLTPEARAELGITDGMVRLSCGLEHSDDLVEDLLNALQTV